MRKDENVLPKAIQKKVDEGRLTMARKLGQLAAFVVNSQIDEELKKNSEDKR